MITSPDNDKLKTIRKLQQKSWREKLDLFTAEGEDLVEAAAAAGWPAEAVLVAGEDVEPALLADVSSLGSGSRAVGIYPRRWSSPGGSLSVYLHAVGDPGNVGTVIRSAHALCDGPVVLGPGCADPFSPKAVRASMGSLFARPPARARFADLPGMRIALDARAERTLTEAAAEIVSEAPAGTSTSPTAQEAEQLSAQSEETDARTAGPREGVAASAGGGASAGAGAGAASIVLCLGAEREGLPPEVLAEAEATARIPLRSDGPDSLNVAMAATVALYDFAHRMAGHA